MQPNVTFKRFQNDQKLTARHHPAHTVAREDGLGIVAVGQQVIKAILGTEARIQRWLGERKWWRSKTVDSPHQMSCEGGWPSWTGTSGLAHILGSRGLWDAARL